MQISVGPPPALVTIFFGANDAALPDRSSARQHVPLLEYKENLKRIVEHIRVGCTVSHTESLELQTCNVSFPPFCIKSPEGVIE